MALAGEHGRAAAESIVEIGYEVAWDEEHTLGARLENGQLVELCGSVLAPSSRAMGRNDWYRRTIWTRGRVVAITRARELYDVAWDALEDFGAPVFPWHSYMVNGVRACIRADQGDAETARQLAQAALMSAEVSDSGLGWSRAKLGLVSDTTSSFHRRIEELAV